MYLRRFNFVFALSASIPLLVVLGFVLYLESYFWCSSLIAVLCCVSFVLSLTKIKKTIAQPTLPLKISTVNSATSEIFGSFIAYVLPLAFSISSSHNILIILFACLLYCSLVTITNTVYPSWIFPLSGYRLYRIKTENGLEALLLSKQFVMNILTHNIKVVELDDCCYIDVTNISVGKK